MDRFDYLMKFGTFTWRCGMKSILAIVTFSLGFAYLAGSLEHEGFGWSTIGGLVIALLGVLMLIFCERRWFKITLEF